MSDKTVPENTNPMLENLLADAEGIGIEQAASEYAGEIAGHFDNDPVADFGQGAVDQISRLINLILAPTDEESPETLRAS